MTMHGFRLLVISMLVSLLLSLVPVSAATADAMVRVIHASHDTPPVDVYFDGKKIVSSLAFTKASSYLTFPSGSHKFALFAEGANPVAEQPVLDTEEWNIPAGAKISIAATGLRQDVHTFLVDDRTAPPEGDTAKLRVVHVGVDVPAVDVVIKGASVLFPAITDGRAFPYQTVDAANYQLDVRALGENTMLATANFSAEAGNIYSVYIMSRTTVQIYDDMATAISEPANVVGMPVLSAGAIAQGVETSLPAMMPATGYPSAHAPLDTRFVLLLLFAAVIAASGLALRRQGMRGR